MRKQRGLFLWAQKKLTTKGTKEHEGIQIHGRAETISSAVTFWRKDGPLSSSSRRARAHAAQPGAAGAGLPPAVSGAGSRVGSRLAIPDDLQPELMEGSGKDGGRSYIFHWLKIFESMTLKQEEPASGPFSRWTNLISSLVLITWIYLELIKPGNDTGLH